MRSGLIAFATLLLTKTVSADETPINKVLKLLGEMQTTLQDESEKDKGANDKMECWCKQSKDNFNKAITDETTKNSEALSEAELRQGKQAEHAATAAAKEEESAEAQKELEEATAARQKEQTAFVEAEKELRDAISAVTSAVTVLKKHQGGSFLQNGSQKDIKQIASVLQQHFTKYQSRHMGTLTNTERTSIESFIQQPEFAAYQSQSGEIFGILTTMQDEFKSDLENAIKENEESKKLFAQTKKAKSELRDSASESAVTNKAAAAENQAAMVKAEEDAEAAALNLANAESSLKSTTESCTTAEEEFTQRVNQRTVELEAVGEALAYLSSDEAFAMFNRGKGANASFIQLSAKVNAGSILNRIRKNRNFDKRDMLSLAQAIKEGTFDKVIKAVEDLVKDIDSQMKSDVTERESCVESLQANAMELQATKNDIAKKEAKEKSLEAQIEELKEKIAANDQEITETKEEQNKASALRAQAHQDYLTEHANAVATVEILNKALTVLSNVYGSSLLQQVQAPPPAGADLKGVQSGGNSVVNLISSIIKDSQHLDELATQSEQKAQKDYETNFQNMNKDIQDLTNENNEHKKSKAASGKKLATLKQDLKVTRNEQKSQQIKNMAREEDCSFLLNNFDLRQEHMQGEIDALNEAKAFLKGMK